MQELYKTSSIYSGFFITTWDTVSAISMFSLFSRVTKEHFTPLCLADCIAVLIVLNTSSYWFHLSAQLHFLVLKCTTCIACVCAHICAIFLGVTQTLNIMLESISVSCIPSFYFAMETDAVSLAECISLQPDKMEPHRPTWCWYPSYLEYPETYSSDANISTRVLILCKTS